MWAKSGSIVRHTATIEKETKDNSSISANLTLLQRSHEDTEQCQVREISTKPDPFHDLPRL
jgi:hypothetical protein